MRRHAPENIPGITALPPSSRGMRIGLFGGSFNPVHDGHRLVAEQCLAKLELDAVWILVSPGNPLKDHTELAPLAQRVEAARAALGSSRIKVTGFEAAHGFRFSYDTVSHLKQALPDRRFVWIMGADNLVGFHRWERWRDLAAIIPIAVYVRPGSSGLAPTSRVAQSLSRYRIDESDAGRLAFCRPPAWVYLHGLMSSLSSSAIRAGRRNV